MNSSYKLAIESQLSSPPVECIPNISTADPHLLDAIREMCAIAPEIHLLDIDASPGIERSVITWIGSLNATFSVIQGILDLLCKSFDLENYSSVHPHIGALDICPIVPIFKRDKGRIIQLTHDFAQRLASQLQLPIFYYGNLSATNASYTIPNIRRGGPDNLKKKIGKLLIPNAGPHGLHTTLGAMLLGVREIMTAYNVNLSTDDLQLGKLVAKEVRSSLPVKAMAWHSTDFDRIQLSMNIYHKSISLPTLYAQANDLATALDTSFTGSEVIGLVSRQALDLPLKPANDMDNTIDHLIQSLGLSEVKHFDPKHHLLEDRIYSLWKVWPDI